MAVTIISAEPLPTSPYALRITASYQGSYNMTTSGIDPNNSIASGFVIQNGTALNNYTTIWTYDFENPVDGTYNISVRYQSPPFWYYDSGSVDFYNKIDQFYELKKITTYSGTSLGYLTLTGLVSGMNYSFDLRDSLFNNIPYTSTYIGGQYIITPTGALADSGVTFSVLYNGVVAAKKTLHCGFVSGTCIKIV